MIVRKQTVYILWLESHQSFGVLFWLLSAFLDRISYAFFDSHVLDLIRALSLSDILFRRISFALVNLVVFAHSVT